MLKPTDPTEVLELLGVIINVVREDEIAAHCPFHTDTHPSFYMNADSGLWMCHSCGRKGNLDALVIEIRGSNEPSLLREIRRKAIRKPRKRIRVPKEDPEPEPDTPVVILARYQAFRRPPKWALDDKKINTDQAHRFGLKWAKGWVIPIWSPYPTGDFDDLLGWQFKRLDFVSNFPKTVKKSEALFGLRELQGKTIILVESPLDVVRLASVGLPAVASYGAYVSRVQLSLLVDHAERIVLALDADEAGEKQTKKIYPRLARALPTTIAEYPEGFKDPGELSNDQIEDVFGDF